MRLQGATPSRTVRTGQVYRSSISNRTHQVREKAMVKSFRNTAGILSDLLPYHLQSSRLKEMSESHGKIQKGSVIAR